LRINIITGGDQLLSSVFRTALFNHQISFTMKNFPSNLKNRRDFVKQSGLAAMGLMTLPSLLGSFRFAARPDVPHFGPAGNYTPRIRAAFIRREENYGMWWPGEIYDG
jgi:hypothetical protein